MNAIKWLMNVKSVVNEWKINVINEVMLWLMK